MMKTIKLLSLMLCLTASSLQAQPLDQQANYDKMSGRLISLLDQYTVSEARARRADLRRPRHPGARKGPFRGGTDQPGRHRS